MNPATVTRFPQVTPPKAPAGLSRDGRRLWVELQGTYGIVDPGGLLLLELAVRSFDDWTAARKLLDKEGLTVAGPGGRKAHPALRAVEVAHRPLMASLRQLHLDVEPIQKVGRPSGK
jgi:hypothetical protein